LGEFGRQKRYGVEKKRNIDFLWPPYVHQLLSGARQKRSVTMRRKDYHDRMWCALQEEIVETKDFNFSL